MRDSCGSSGTGETPQAFTPRRLTARPAESEHLEGKSTTTHYLVNSKKYVKTAFLIGPQATSIFLEFAIGCYFKKTFRQRVPLFVSIDYLLVY